MLLWGARTHCPGGTKGGNIPAMTRVYSTMMNRMMMSSGLSRVF